MNKLHTHPTARHVKGKVIVTTGDKQQITLDPEDAMKLAHELMAAAEKARKK